MFKKLNNKIKRTLHGYINSYTITEQENIDATERLYQHCKEFTAQWKKEHPTLK